MVLIWLQAKYKLHLLNYGNPTVLVGLITVLDGAELIVQPFADGSCLTVFGEFIGAVLAQVVNPEMG